MTSEATAVADRRTQVRTDGGARVTLDDRTVDEGLPELRWHLRSLVLGGARTIHVDLSRTSRMGSNVLAALLSAHRACRARGGGVVLVNPNRQVTDLVRRTGLARVFRIERAPHEATPLGAHR